MPYDSAVTRDLNELKQRFELLSYASQAAQLLMWDRQTYMPEAAAATRGRQSAALDALVHEKLADRQVGEWLSRLEEAELEPDDSALVRLCRRRFDHAVCLPASFVERLAAARSRAQAAWLQARQHNDYSIFEPHLGEMFTLSRARADYIGYEDHPYDALHDEYEPGSSAARVKELFDRLRPALVELVGELSADAAGGFDPVLDGQYDEQLQDAFAREEVARFGFDFDRGRLDPTVHPFAQGLGSSDVRITTRYQRGYLPGGVFAAFHEAGHGLYEQGLPERWEASPLGEAVSLGIHESQSRLWENLVGRSLGYWKGAYGRLQAKFPEQLSTVPLERFVLAVNRVEPSLIRIEADEVTYNLHIIIRFQLELALLSGELDAAGLPDAWNESYRDLLGIEPPDDRRGCLQDVHWSHGLIGYFPTYALGNLMSVQIFEAARAELPDLEGSIERSDFAPLLDWLREKLHSRGSRHLPGELLELATGRSLDAQPYLDYLSTKFNGLRELAQATES